jgi:hypothetical protein
MTNYIHIFNFNPKAVKRINCDNRSDDNSIRGSNLKMASGFRRVYTYCQSAFKRDHCDRSAGINSQFKKHRVPFIANLGLAQKNSAGSIKFKLAHGLESYLKCRGISLGKFIFGIFHENVVNALKRQKFSIDLIPTRTVSYEFSRNRNCGGFINLVYGNKKPLTMKALFDSFNFLRFHNITSGIEDSIFHGTSQGCVSKLVLCRTWDVGCGT